MSTSYPLTWPQFYTATIYKWLPLLNKDKNKDIIISSLQYLVNERKIDLNAFVVMNTHIHLIWQILAGNTAKQIQLSFMKYTAQQIKFEVEKDDPWLLEKCKVNKHDREYQIWKRKPLSIELSDEKIFYQKLGYIHDNPVKAGLCKFPEEYHYSSALFYETGIDKFNMLNKSLS